MSALEVLREAKATTAKLSEALEYAIKELELEKDGELEPDSGGARAEPDKRT